MNINKRIFITSCIFATIVVSYANQKGQRQGGNMPPKEAISACEGQKVGFECTVSTPRGNLTGQCMNTPDEKYFVCMLKGGPHKR